MFDIHIHSYIKYAKRKNGQNKDTKFFPSKADELWTKLDSSWDTQQRIFTSKSLTWWDRGAENNCEQIFFFQKFYFSIFLYFLTSMKFKCSIGTGIQP